MRLSPLLAGIALAMSMAGTVLAAPPPGVTGLRAEIQDGSRAVLRWDAALGDIAYYRVYYSTVSILEHQGEYDDFEQTAGPLAEYTLEGIPAGGSVYAAVMAVNTVGEESEFFSEEIRISDAGSAASVPEPIQEPVREEAPATPDLRLLELLSAEAISPTEVRLQFSEPVQIRAKNARSSFVIRQTGGEQLLVRSASTEGAIATLSTNEQRPGVVYELRLTDTLTEQTGFRIDDANRVSLFTGYGTVEQRPTGASSSSSITENAPAPSSGSGGILPGDDNVPNIRGLSLQTMRNPDGRYSVKADWDPSSVSSQIAFLVVGQSFDGGKTVRAPYLVPANALNTTINGVPPGMFGLFIQTMDVQGGVSPGVFESVLLGARIPITQVAPALAAQVLQEEEEGIAPVPYPQQVSSAPQPQHLPQSGVAALLFVFAFVGGVLGWRKIRRERLRA